MKIFHHIPAWLILLLAACATPQDSAVTDSEHPYVLNQFGRIVRADPTLDYVILECAVLPDQGETFTVYRNGKTIGTVMTSRHRSGRYVAAEILGGRPLVGDWFRGHAPGTTGQ